MLDEIYEPCPWDIHLSVCPKLVQANFAQRMLPTTLISITTNRNGNMFSMQSSNEHKDVRIALRTYNICPKVV